MRCQLFLVLRRRLAARGTIVPAIGQWALVVWLVTGTLTPAVSADELFWDGISAIGDLSLDGVFGDGVNWGTSRPSFPPGRGDIATFDLDANYTVRFDGDEQSDELRVEAGRVTFASNDATVRTYRLTTGRADANISGGTLQIGMPGNPVFLNLPNVRTNGNTDVSVMNIGSGSDGTVIVNGTRSRLDVLGATNHNLGLSGARGELSIMNDGFANYGVNGTLNVGDSVNDGSEGAVTVESGGRLNTGHLNIATSTSAATGSVTVEGNSSIISQLLTRADLIVGSASGGSGSLSVLEGGRFDTGDGDFTVDATGELNVDGGTLNVFGDWTLHEDAEFNFDSGTINVQGGSFAPAGAFDFGSDTNQPHFQVTAGGQVEFSGSWRIGGAAHTSAEMTVSRVAAGVRSTLMNSGAGHLYVGDFGDGILRIENGALVEVQDSVILGGGISNPGGSGEVTVGGTGGGFSATLNVGGDLRLGSGNIVPPFGEAILTVEDGGVVNVTGTTRIRPLNRLEVNSGGVFNAGSDVIIDGGELIENSGGLVNLAAVNSLTASNSQINLSSSSISVPNDAFFFLDSGSLLASGGSITIGETETPGFGISSSITVRGEGSSLSPGGLTTVARDGGGGILEISNDAHAFLNSLIVADGNTDGTSGTLFVDDGATVDVFDSISIATGGGDIQAEVLIQANESHLNQSSGTTLTIGHASEGTALVSITDTGILSTGTGGTTINATATLQIDGGTFNTNSDVLVDGGMIQRLSTGGDDFNLASDTKLTAQNGASVSFNGDYAINDHTSFGISSESTLMVGGTLKVGDEDGVGSLVIENGNSMLDVNGNMRIGSGNGTALVNIRNFAMGDLGDLHLANTENADTVATLNVLANADVTTDDIFVADAGNVGSSGGFTVGGNASLSQNGAATLTVGHATDGSAGISVSSGGTFDTGTGAVVIHETGQLFITHNNNIRGTFNANGPMTVRGTVVIQQLIDLGQPFGGGTLNANDDLTVEGGDVMLGIDGVINAGQVGVTSGGSVNITGGEMNVSDELTIDNVEVNLSQTGVLNADEISPVNGGALNFTGGVLHVDTFNGDLNNDGGTVAPGDSAGNTLILGNYTQVSGALEIELGGTSPGSEHDLLSVTGNVILQGGDLELRLLDDFTPQPDNVFTVLNSTSLFGVLDNVTTGQRLQTLDGRGSFLVHYGAGSIFETHEIRLSEFELAGLPGDYNEDGVVNAADYVVWRDNLGSLDALPNDDTAGVASDDYQRWKMQFGEMAGSGSDVIANTAVPEPATLVLMLLAMVGWCLVGREPENVSGTVRAQSV